MYKKIILSLLVFTQIILEMHAVTITAVNDGAWASGSSWDQGNAPQCGDTIMIPAGFIISITTMESYTSCGQPMNIIVSGELHFQTGKKILLPCNSQVQVNSGGRITADNGGGNSNYIEICSQIVWNTESGDVEGPALFTASAPLPVQLLFFDAEPVNRTVEIKWATASENNSLNFSVERSTDGFNFHEITKVQAAGNSIQTLHYSTADNSPPEGYLFYRLVETEIDGKRTEYTTVGLFISFETINIYPNPSDGKFSVAIPNKKKDVYRIVSSCGKEVYVFSTVDDETKIDVAGIEPGVYFLLSENGKVRKKIIVQ